MSFLGMGRGDNPIQGSLTYNTYGLRPDGTFGPTGTQMFGSQYGAAAFGPGMQQVFSNPRTMEIIQAWQSDPNAQRNSQHYQRQLEQIMNQAGASLSNHGSFEFNPSTGQVGLRTSDRNQDYVYPAVMLATMALGGAAAVSAAGGLGAIGGGLSGGTGAGGSTAAAPAFTPAFSTGATLGQSAAAAAGANSAIAGSLGAPAAAAFSPTFSTGATLAQSAAAANPAGGAGGAGGGWWQSLLRNYMGGGSGSGMQGQLIQSGMQMGGAALSAYANHKAQQEQNRIQGALAQMGDSLTRDQSLAQQAPTGWAQNYQQNTLLRQLMLQRLTNGGALTPSNPDLAQRLGNRGQLTIPAEWQQLNPFGVDQTMASLAQRQGVLDRLSNGTGPGLNFNQFNINPQQAQALQGQTDAYRQYATDSRQQLLDAIGLSRNPQRQQRNPYITASQVGIRNNSSLGKL